MGSGAAEHCSQPVPNFQVKTSMRYSFAIFYQILFICGLFWYRYTKMSQGSGFATRHSALGRHVLWQRGCVSVTLMYCAQLAHTFTLGCSPSILVFPYRCARSGITRTDACAHIWHQAEFVSNS